MYILSSNLKKLENIAKKTFFSLLTILILRPFCSTCAPFYHILSVFKWTADDLGCSHNTLNAV